MNRIALFVFTMGLTWGAFAQHSKKELEQDIVRHRAIAEAHEAAAKCLESGKKPGHPWARLRGTRRLVAMVGWDN